MKSISELADDLIEAGDRMEETQKAHREAMHKRSDAYQALMNALLGKRIKVYEHGGKVFETHHSYGIRTMTVRDAEAPKDADRPTFGGKIYAEDRRGE